MDHQDEDEPDIENELTKAYIAGLFEGVGTITARIHKDSEYRLGYVIEAEITLNRKKPHAVHIVDDWAARNGIKTSVTKYDDKYRLNISRLMDIQRFLEMIAPYMYDRFDTVQLILEEIIPRIENKDHLESREKFMEMVDVVEEIRELSTKSRRESKYTREYFEDLWEDELADS